MVQLTFDDPRPILSIWYPGEDAVGYSTDPRHDTSTGKIVAYREHGVSDFTPYFAVYDHGGNIKARVPAYLVTVIYANEEASDVS